MLTASAILTYAGQNLIVRSDTEGKKIDWLYFKAGDGDVATIEEIKNLTDVAGNTIIQPNVALVSAIDGSSYFISSQYSNEGFTEQKQVREYALFAKLEGDANPILYSYLGLGSGFVMPPYTGIEWFQTIEFITIVSQDTMALVKFNPDALVDMETFMREMAKKVDKTQITQEQLEKSTEKILSGAATNRIFENGVGAKIKGYIEDGTAHAVGEVWLSRNNKGEYKCLVANSENYINMTPGAEKWLQIDDLTNAGKLQNLGVDTYSNFYTPNGAIIGYSEGYIYKQKKRVCVTGFAKCGDTIVKTLNIIPVGFRPSTSEATFTAYNITTGSTCQIKIGSDGSLETGVVSGGGLNWYTYYTEYTTA